MKGRAPMSGGEGRGISAPAGEEPPRAGKADLQHGPLRRHRTIMAEPGEVFRASGLLNMKNSRHGRVPRAGGEPKILILKNGIEEENPRERGKAGQAATAFLL